MDRRRRARRVLGSLLVLVLALSTGSLRTLGARAAMQAPRELHVSKWDFPPKFSNVTVNVVGDAGHNLAPYEFWRDHFPKAGITITIIEVPFEGVYEKEKTEFVAGSRAFDAVLLSPAYIGGFARQWGPEPLAEAMGGQ